MCLDVFVTTEVRNLFFVSRSAGARACSRVKLCSSVERSEDSISHDAMIVLRQSNRLHEAMLQQSRPTYRKARRDSQVED